MISATCDVDRVSQSSVAEAIQQAAEEHGINPYNLAFTVDGDDITYVAEYCKGLHDFRSRQELLKMETEVKRDESAVEAAAIEAVRKRLRTRSMPEADWIENHSSGTLRKCKRIGFSYRTQYLAERVAYEFGFGFEIVPRSQITFGDAIAEQDCHPITEAGWHIERYMQLDVLGDRFEAKYINVTRRDGTVAEGVGIIVRETSAPWIPAGHIVFSIVTEFDKQLGEWRDAINPF